MRTLHGYLTRQVLAALIMTVAVFTFVLLLGAALQDAVTLLMKGQVSVVAVGRSLVLLMPWVLAFALPMGLLTAALLVFGRLSADQELTAIRAGGVSLLALVSPVLMLGLVFSLVCAAVNLELAPAARVAYKRLLLDVGSSRSELILPARTFIKDFPGRIIYIGDIQGAELKDILMCQLGRDDSVEFYLRAAEGTLLVDRARQQVTVRLRDAWHVSVHEGRRQPVYMGESEFTETLTPEAQRKTRLSDMTFRQLRAELAELERRLGEATEMKRGPRVPEAERRRDARRQMADVTMPVRVLMHRQISFSFACLAFLVVGIPLGIRAHRRETTFGIFIALVLVMVYYSFFILAQALDTRPEYFPHLIVWVPNFLFQAIGGVLLWRANRGV